MKVEVFCNKNGLVNIPLCIYCSNFIIIISRSNSRLARL